MEPKPTFTWHVNNRGVWHLHVNNNTFTNYDIAIYQPFGNPKVRWHAVSDYESDYADTIIMTYDLDEAKAAAERAWFSLYLDTEKFISV